MTRRQIHQEKQTKIKDSEYIARSQEEIFIKTTIYVDETNGSCLMAMDEKEKKTNVVFKKWDVTINGVRIKKKLTEEKKDIERNSGEGRWLENKYAYMSMSKGMKKNCKWNVVPVEKKTDVAVSKKNLNK